MFERKQKLLADPIFKPSSLASRFVSLDDENMAPEPQAPQQAPQQAPLQPVRMQAQSQVQEQQAKLPLRGEKVTSVAATTLPLILGALGHPYDKVPAVVALRKSLRDEVFHAITIKIRQSYGWDDALMGAFYQRVFVQQLKSKFACAAADPGIVRGDVLAVHRENQRLVAKATSPRVR